MGKLEQFEGVVEDSVIVIKAFNGVGREVPTYLLEAITDRVDKKFETLETVVDRKMAVHLLKCMSRMLGGKV